MRQLIARMLGVDADPAGRVFEGEGGGEGSGGTGAGAGAGGAATPKTYTEAEFSALLAERDALKTQHSEAATRLTAFEQAQLTEQQKLEQRAAQAEKDRDAHTATLKQERLERQIEREAAALSIVDPEAALKLLDAAKIEYDGDRPKNVKALLEQLVKDKPYLAGAPASGGSATNGARTQSASGATFTKSQIADRAFWKANEAAIMAAMRDGRITD